MGVKCQVYYLVFATDDEVNFLLLCNSRELSIIRCVTNAPDGSSPRGYDGVLAADYRLKKSGLPSTISSLVLSLPCF
jgi:hypothetical protein